MTATHQIYLSEYAPSALVSAFAALGHTISRVHSQGVTYAPVDSHPDIFCCKMGVTRHSHLFMGDKQELGYAYPANCRFNAVCLDHYFIHNLKITSPTLLGEAKKLGLECIHVNQGYTKCNTVVVDGHSVITADQGILRALRDYPAIDVRPVRQGFVRLDGFPYGFLGGASGRVDGTLFFNGDLSAHPDFTAIRQFVESRGVALRFFPEYELTDIGSILTD